MAAQIIDGKAVAERMIAEISGDVAVLHHATGIVPHLAAVLIGDDSASAVYVRNKQKACAKAGLKSTLYRLPSETNEIQLLQLVEQLNADTTVHGILVQMPVPKQINPQAVILRISPEKDVDGFHPVNVGRVWIG